MKSKTYLVEVVLDAESELFLVRNSKGEILKATSKGEELVNFFRNDVKP